MKFPHLSITLTIVLLPLLFTSATGQWNASVQTLSVYDDNSFAYRIKKPDVYHQIFGAVSYDIQTEFSFTQIFYYGAWVQFQRFADRTYHQHLMGALYQLQVDHRGDDEDPPTLATVSTEQDGSEEMENTTSENAEEEETSEEDGSQPESGLTSEENESVAEEPFSDSLVTYLMVKPYLGGRFDRPRYDFYDYTLGGVSVTFRRHLVGPLMGRFVGDAEYKTYPFLELFTHMEFNAGFLLSARIAERVEVFGGAVLGYKEYTESNSDTTWIEVREGRRTYWQEVITTWAAPSTKQFVFTAGLSLTPGQGWTSNLVYTMRSNPESKARVLEREDLDFGNEDDVFDDRYGYQSDELDIVASGPLPGSLTALISMGYSWKRYPRVATDMEGLPLPGDPKRRDQRFNLNAQFMIPVLSASSGFRLSVGGSYSFYRNMSNNEYHDYHIHQTGLVVEAGW